MRKTEADRHDLDCNDSDLSIVVWLAIVNVLVEILEEVNVGIEPYADAVNEDHWEPRLGCVRSVPVGDVLGWRSLGGSECNWSQWEQRKEAAVGLAVEVVPVVTQSHVSQEVHEADHEVPEQAPVRHLNTIEGKA